ncbi:MAG: hypothetical protein ACI82I_001764 [Gammaproteobacteria bacterium]|jgi:hypothetical protein
MAAKGREQQVGFSALTKCRDRELRKFGITADIDALLRTLRLTSTKGRLIREKIYITANPLGVSSVGPGPRA